MVSNLLFVLAVSIIKRFIFHILKKQKLQFPKTYFYPHAR